MPDAHNLNLIMTITGGLAAALVLGYITFRLGLSSIVGYLLAGIVVGPYTPGFVADHTMAEQLAEIGVVLLMFGVGMHFNLDDLLAVRRVALPGALGQTLGAIVLGSLAVVAYGWSWSDGLVIGMSISVASTVVLIRVLDDNRVLETEQGHIAVGWLIVEDLLTVLALVMLPAIASAARAEGAVGAKLAAPLGLAVLKIVALGVVVLWAGRKVIPRLLERVARTRLRELFTLTILVVALTVATGSALIFGVSMALGAFLAGMVVGQSEVSHQAAADALPMRDAFAVLFFVSVGMLFDPRVILDNLVLFLALLSVIMLAKPVVALVIVWTLGYSVRTALTVAVALAQIGEFSFILADLATSQKLLDERGYGLLVACAMVSITLNPLLFGGIGRCESWLRRRPRLWRWLSLRSEARVRRLPLAAPPVDEGAPRPRAIIVGYGPVGRTASAILQEFDVEPVIVDLNVDTIAGLLRSGHLAIYGDAGSRGILTAAGIKTAKYLLITVPDVHSRTVIVIVARELNPEVKVFVRARYMEERAWLEEIGVTDACFEETEAAIGLATILLQEVGADEERIRLELRRTRTRLAFQSTDHPLDQSADEPLAKEG